MKKKYFGKVTNKKIKHESFNTDLLNNFYAYSNSNAIKFNEELKRLIKMNYKITNFIVDKDGVFKLTAELQKSVLTECLLRTKQMPNGNRVLNGSPTYPECCCYNLNGICLCSDFSSCLYQKTLEHESIIKEMVEIYNNQDKDYHDQCSTYYEDTEYGRIFSNAYNHLNKIPKEYLRLYGK